MDEQSGGASDCPSRHSADTDAGEKKTREVGPGCRSGRRSCGPPIAKSPGGLRHSRPMMSPEQNELENPGRSGHKCGALMRHYWQPVALADNCPPSDRPRRCACWARYFVLFRDEHGRHGLLEPRLPASRRRPRLGRLEGAACAACSTVGCSTVDASAWRHCRAGGQRALPGCAPAQLSRRGEERNHLRLSR